MFLIKKYAPLEVIVHYPKTLDGKRNLAQRAAEVHADFAISVIKNLNCPLQQKLELVDAVLNAIQ